MKKPDEIRKLENETGFPLMEDFYIGENPNNFQQHDNPNSEYGEPLPKKYLDKFPEYFVYFCKPYMGKDGNIKLNIKLTEEFFSAMKIHYGLKEKPSREQLCNILSKEIKKCM
jgi:hypothetical protein